MNARNKNCEVAEKQWSTSLRRTSRCLLMLLLFFAVFWGDQWGLGLEKVLSASNEQTAEEDEDKTTSKDLDSIEKVNKNVVHEPDMNTLLGQRLSLEKMRSLQTRWSAFRNSSISWGKGVGRKIAFTFDDGPSQVVTPLVMEYLEDHGIRGTFFVNGRRFSGRSAVAVKNREILLELAKRGHYIGNHTHSHPMLKTQPTNRQKWEVFTVHKAIMRTTGLRPFLYRPPFGGQTSYSRRLLEKAGYATVMWNLSSNDPFGRHVEKVHKTVMNKVHRDNGGIILMHDTNGWAACSIPLLVQSILIESCKLIRRGEEPYLILGLEHFRVPEGEKAPRPTPAGQLEAAHRRAEIVKFCSLKDEAEETVENRGK